MLVNSSNGDTDGTSPAAYVPNRLDPLDIAIAQMLNTTLPPHVQCYRVDPPLTLAQAGQCETLAARYQIIVHTTPASAAAGGVAVTNDGKPVMCKLVDRVGPRVVKGEKKVLVRIGTGWQEFEAYVTLLLDGLRA